MDKSDVKGWGSTPGLHWKLPVLSAGEVSGIPSVAVKCVDIRRNTSGEGGLPLRHSRKTVSNAVLGLSPSLSHQTCSSVYAPFTPSKSG